MTQVTPPTRTGQHFAVTDLGSLTDLQGFTFEASTVPLKVEGKVFLKQILNLTSCEISLNTLPPNASVPFYHKHRLNEEIYLYIRGTGEFQVDDCVFPVQEGTIVRVDPNGERCIRNTSATENLSWVVIQSRAESYADHTIQDGFRVQKQVSWVDKQVI